MNREQYFIYPEDKNGQRTGHTICVVVKDGKIFHGMSLCSPDDQFEYAKGRELSLERANEAHVRFEARQAQRKADQEVK